MLIFYFLFINLHNTKVIRLKAENIKKIKAIDISLDKPVIKVTGKNAQGKSSILDSLMYALAGKKSIPEKVIREGEDKGMIELETDTGLLIQRSFTDKNSYLKVTTKDGASYPKAQEKLSGLIGSLSFDPLEFTQYDSKKQKELLIQLTGVDTSPEDSEYTELYEERREVGIQGKTAKGELDSIEKPESKPERIDTDVAFMQLRNFESELKTVQQEAERLNNIDLKIQELEEELQQLQKEAGDVSRSLEKRRSEEEIQKDIDKANEQMTTASQVNKEVDLFERWETANEKVEKFREQYTEMTDKLKEIESRKAEKIAAAKMPIEGLSFSEDGITYNDIPFEQLSSAEKLRVSMAMAIAMNPDLRIIRIMDGSLLDSENMAIIEEMAGSSDYTAIIEIVDESGEVGYFIEEGEVKNNNYDK